MNSLQELFQRVETVVNENRHNITDHDVLAALSEEVGEYARAVRVENNAVICHNKRIKEPSTTEAVDILLVAIEAFVTRGGDYELFVKTIPEKLEKWTNLWEEENE